MGLYTLWAVHIAQGCIHCQDCIHYGTVYIMGCAHCQDCIHYGTVYIARTVYIMGLYTSWAVHMGGHVSGRPLPEIAVFTE